MRKKSTKDLSESANNARKVLEPLNGKIVEPGVIIKTIKNGLGVHERTANRILKDLIASEQIIKPCVYKLTLYK
jgi:hypothetical protein